MTNPFDPKSHDKAIWQQESAISPQDDKLGGRNLDSILRIPVTIQVVLGSATMPVANLMKLGRGAIVPLDHRVGEPVDVVVYHEQSWFWILPALVLLALALLFLRLWWRVQR